MIGFVQPFGLQAPGGGSRILRALLQTEHPPVLSVVTGVAATPPLAGIEEIHLPLRPGFGRIERTRFQVRLKVLDRVFRSRFEQRLRSVLVERGVKLLHLVPYTYDIVPLHRVATELGIPYFLNVHDELEYAQHGHPRMKEMVASLGEAWRGAKGIFVISDEMGEEYSRRYGKRAYETVTDGITGDAGAPLARPAKSLRVYFMGLFHFRYAANLRAVLDALKLVRVLHPDWEITVTCRCAAIFGEVKADDVPVRVLPFAPESEVAKDMETAELLYQPLPFEALAASFGRYSLSTKLVTYLGSGLPIFYHGPADTAACKLLASHDAAVICTTLDPERIAVELLGSLERRDAIVHHALELGRARFMLADQQKRFWGAMSGAMSAAL